MIAHRGASGTRPENTLPAYELAVAQRADMIEIDLHRTADGAIVITHDEDLAGLGGRGEIADASLADVLRLDAGGGERVPTLSEVLDGFGERIPFNLELKVSGRGAYPGLEQATLAEVGRRGLLGRMLFSSFDDGVLARLRDLAPESRIALLVSPRSAERPIERARALGAEALNPWRGMAGPELIDAVHAAGLSVYPYTVDDPQEMADLVARGVDGLFTNHPDRLRALLAEDAPAGHPGGAERTGGFSPF